MSTDIYKSMNGAKPIIIRHWWKNSHSCCITPPALWIHVASLPCSTIKIKKNNCSTGLPTLSRLRPEIHQNQENGTVICTITFSRDVGKVVRKF